VPLVGRLATASDALALAGFTCASTGESHELEVEAWIRQDSLAWSQTAPDARLVLFEEDGALVAVAGHEALDEDDPGEGRFIPALAVWAGVQAQGLGPRVMTAIFDDAAAICPGGTLVWRVRPENFNCQKMCQALGFDDYTYPPDAKPMMQYETDLPGDTTNGS
jgi:GNAT superfamily N-acetyltransferase